MKTGRQINENNEKQYYLNTGKTLCQDTEGTSIEGLSYDLNQYAKKSYVEDNFLRIPEEGEYYKKPDSGIPTEDIADEVITSNKLADGAVTLNKLSNDIQSALSNINQISVNENASGSEIFIHQGEDEFTAIGNVRGAITTDLINSEAVTTNKIADEAITSNKIASGAITTNKLASNTVTSDKIADLSITSNKILQDAISSNKIENQSIYLRHLAPQTISQLQGQIESKLITLDKVTDFEDLNAGEQWGNNHIFYNSNQIQLYKSQKLVLYTEYDVATTNENLMFSILNSNKSEIANGVNPYTYSAPETTSIYVGVRGFNDDDCPLTNNVTVTIYDTLESVLERVKQLENNN